MHLTIFEITYEFLCITNTFVLLPPILDQVQIREIKIRHHLGTLNVEESATTMILILLPETHVYFMIIGVTKYPITLPSAGVETLSTIHKSVIIRQSDIFD